MRIVECDQGTDEWRLARLGVPSASMYSSIVTTKGKWSKSAEKYIDQLVFERITGMPTEFHLSEWMIRGTELEPEARDMYTLMTGNEVQEVGFCLHDTLQAGCSPDGLVGEEGGLEIKVPMPETHEKYRIAGEKSGNAPGRYYAQIQGNLWITQRKWWDFLSYNPDGGEHSFFLVRVQRDEKFINYLEENVGEVVRLIEEQVNSFIGSSDDEKIMVVKSILMRKGE